MSVLAVCVSTVWSVVAFPSDATNSISSVSVSPRTTNTVSIGRIFVRQDDARPPASIAPLWNDFVGKCRDGSVRREDLISLKRFIAASSLSESERKRWTDEARKLAQEGHRTMKRKGKDNP